MIVDCLDGLKMERRNQRPKGIFSRMDNKTLAHYIAKNYLGISPIGLRLTDRAAYEAVRKRKLTPGFIEWEIMVARKRSFWNMEDDEFLDFVKTHYEGASRGEFRRKDRYAYEVARSRDLIGRLVEDGILVRM